MNGNESRSLTALDSFAWSGRHGVAYVTVGSGRRNFVRIKLEVKVGCTDREATHGQVLTTVCETETVFFASPALFTRQEEDEETLD